MPNRFTQVTTTNFADALPIINKNFADLDGETITKVFKGVNNVDSLVQGKLPNGLGNGYLLRRSDGTVAIAMYIDDNGTPILKVSKDGFDALTAANQDLVFNSAQNVLKIVSSDTISLSRSAGVISGSTTVPHGLSFTPIVIAYIFMFGSYMPLPYIETTPSGTGTLSVDKDIRIVVDSTNIIVSETVDSASLWLPVAESFSIKYYLLQESAS